MCLGGCAGGGSGAGRWLGVEAGGPIVLVSFEALRADAASGFGGPPGLTPHLAALARRMTWTGTAIAASSRPAPALASLITGLSPWQHQILDAPSRLDAGIWTLAEALRATGRRTSGFREVTTGRGWGQGLDQYRELGQLQRVKALLGELTAAPSFTWIHLEMLGGVFVRHDRFLKRLGPVPPELPARLGAAARARMLAAGPNPQERARLWALYRLNVAAADELLGVLIAALESSGQWERSTVVVVGTQGVALGEPTEAGESGAGSPADGGISNLTRAELETPVMLKLPAASPAVAVAAGERVALARLWATLVESAGGSAPAAVAPSLLRDAPAGALSELYAEAGHHWFSWVEGETQLLRLVPAGGGARGAGARAPFTGSGPARLRLVRWTAEGVENLDRQGDPGRDALRDRLASAMEQEFTFFSEQEAAPVAAADDRVAGAAPAAITERDPHGR